MINIIKKNTNKKFFEIQVISIIFNAKQKIKNNNKF